MDNEIVAVAKDVSDLAATKLTQISAVARATRMLAMNARIEANRFGDRGAAFTVVADEVAEVSRSVQQLANSLDQGLTERIAVLDQVGENVQGTRLADLALNMIDVVDRNLYERTCDVRWWATDSAVHGLCAARDDPAAREHATTRLGVILDSYTVYLDLWVADTDGRVIAHARPDLYPSVLGSSVADQEWFSRAVATRDGHGYVAADVHAEPLLHDAVTTVYATAVREGGAVDGRVIGALGIHFDWAPQAAAVVRGVRLSEAERGTTRCLIVDRSGLVLAASDDAGVLSELIPLRTEGPSGHYRDGQRLVGYAHTPGYETYEGLGWYGIITVG